MTKKKKLLFVTATHGDEELNVEMVKKIKKTSQGKMFDWIIANPRALKKGVRFTETDLNRSFPGLKNGSYEERRADQLMKTIKKYERVIDFHGTVSQTGIFAILLGFTKKNMELALRFNTKNIVLWPEAKESAKSLSTFSPSGIELESGPKKSPVVRRQLKKLVVGFLKNLDIPIDLEGEMKKRNFFLAGESIAEKDKKLKLRDWKKVKNFYPLFVGQYPGIACFKLKKINPQKYFQL